MALFDFLPSKEQIIQNTSNTANRLVSGILDRGEDVLRGKLGIVGDLLLGADESRLRNAGLNGGASPDSVSDFSPSANAETDTRVRLLTPSGSTIRRLVFESSIMAPLRYSDFGVIFPYQPNIAVFHQANYQLTQPAQTNYPYPSYESSQVASITIPGEFSASNIKEAKYMLAAIHFFRTATKSFYGQDANAGTPPPVLRLRGGGKYMFDDVPVVVTEFSYVLPDDVDYIPVNINDLPPNYSTLTGSNSITMVPTTAILTVGLQPIYSRSEISQDFSVKSFANGNLVSRGGKGGFI